MSEFESIFVTAISAVIITVAGCMTYYNVIESNNTKDIVTKAIERGIDPVAAACASQITSSNNDKARSTCEKLAIIKGK
jgi:glutamine amidotransferase PdxT